MRVRNSLREGVRVLGSTGSLRLTGDDNFVIDSCRHGIRVASKLLAAVSGDAKLLRNGGFGMMGIDGATLVVSRNARIESSGWGGVHGRLGTTIAISGGVQITSNGQDTSTSNSFFPRFRSGVSVYSGSRLTVFANGFGIPLIHGNRGRGVVLDLASLARLAGISVTFSSDEGFVALNNSTAEFVPGTAANTLQSNNKDLLCDNTSVVIGDFEAQTVNCGSTGGNPN